MATDVVRLQYTYQQTEAIAQLQRTCDQQQQQLALATHALLYAVRGQWDAARFGLESVEAFLVSLNPALQGKVNPVPFGQEPLARPAELSGPPVRLGRSAYCWTGRPYGPPIAFVVHTQSGGESGTVAELISSSSQLSAHYFARLDGTLETRIDPADRTWSNGILEPGNTWAGIAEECGVDPTLDPNHVAVTCDTEDRGSTSEPVTDRQYEALQRAAWQAKQRFPKSLRYMACHSDISPQSRANCPGERWVASGRLQALAEALDLKMVGM